MKPNGSERCSSASPPTFGSHILSLRIKQLQMLSPSPLNGPGSPRRPTPSRKEITQSLGFPQPINRRVSRALHRSSRRIAESDGSDRLGLPLGSRTGARSRTREPETSLRQRRRIEVLRLPRSRPPTRFSVLGYGRETGRASSKPHVQPCVSVARIARAAQHSTDSGRLKFTAATRTRPLRLELVLDDIGRQITAALAFRLAHVSSHNFSVTHARALRCSRHRRRLVS